jgi:lactoylglutathione lyase
MNKGPIQITISGQAGSCSSGFLQFIASNRYFLKLPLAHKNQKSMLKLAYTICYVKDVVKAIEFYEKAFGFKRKFIAETLEYGELDTGATTLSFAVVSLARTNLSKGFIESDPVAKPFAMEIGITTGDVPKAVQAAVKAGATLTEEAKTKPWGQTVAYVRDPEGFLIEICTPMD